jgi:hypothetical protein
LILQDAKPRWEVTPCYPGPAVILFDPIFQGLALALSRLTVPIVYYVVKRLG